MSPHVPFAYLEYAFLYDSPTDLKANGEARMRKILLFAGLSIVMMGCGAPIHRYPRSVLPTNLSPLPVDINHDHALAIDAERVALTREYFAIHHPDLSIPSGDSVTSIQFEPRLVVVHYTAIPTLQETLEIFAPNFIGGNRTLVAANGRLNVGIQFIVDRDGSIYASYPDNVMSRHVIGLNHVAIGIENVGNADLDRDGRGRVPLTHAQLDANEKLIRFLVDKYPSIDFVIAHYEYTDLEDPRHPAHSLFREALDDYRTEKVDPGKRFMRELRSRLGIAR